MSGINIDRIALRLDGVSAEIAQAALDGLDGELTRRLGMRGIDLAALGSLPPSVRLPMIDPATPLDADSLRACIAEGLAAFLGGAAPAGATGAG
jgi:hypothetical protein